MKHLARTAGIAAVALITLGGCSSATTDTSATRSQEPGPPATTQESGVIELHGRSYFNATKLSDWTNFSDDIAEIEVISEREGLPKGRNEEPQGPGEANEYIPRTLTIEVIKHHLGTRQAPQTFELQNGGWAAFLNDGKRTAPVPAGLAGFRLEVGSTYLAPLAQTPNPNDPSQTMWVLISPEAALKVTNGKLQAESKDAGYAEAITGITVNDAVAKLKDQPVDPIAQKHNGEPGLKRWAATMKEAAKKLPPEEQHE